MITTRTQLIQTDNEYLQFIIDPSHVYTDVIDVVISEFK